MRVTLEDIERNPAKFGRELVQHPSYLAEIVEAGFFEDMVDVFEKAGLIQMLWSIAHNIRGYVPARRLIKNRLAQVGFLV